MPQKTDLVPPETSKGDYAHALAKGAIASVPLAGNIGAELFELILGPPLERRKREWMETVAEAINELRDKVGVKPEHLSANPQFVDMLCRATQIAVRTSQNEKLDALRNAVLNAALPNAPDDSLQHIFVGWVDALTEWHLRILALLADPRAWFQRSGRTTREQYIYSGSLDGMIKEAYPELQDQGALLDKIAVDLFHERLINTQGFSAMMSARGMYEKRRSGIHTMNYPSRCFYKSKALARLR